MMGTTTRSTDTSITISPLSVKELADADRRWPGNPFHQGEMAFQQNVGSQDFVMTYAPRFLIPKLTGVAKQFYPQLPFVAAAARDQTGAMWSTLLENSQQNHAFLRPTSDSTLQLDQAALPVPGDALETAFTQGKDVDVGVLGLMFENARRNRVNGRVNSSLNNNNPNGGVTLTVDLAFGNCPQYIKPRQKWNWVAPQTNTQKTHTRTTQLLSHQVQWIQTAETLFTATGYRGDGVDPRFGNDASHRGGPPGFVTVQNSSSSSQKSQRQTIMWVEFPGNNHFNSLGNLIMDDRIGICFPNFENGGLLQVSGTAQIEMGDLRSGGRRVIMTVQAVNELPPGALPIRWETNKDPKGTKVRVAKIVQETSGVKSFYMEPVIPEDNSSNPANAEFLPFFQAGQRLPIDIPNPDIDGDVLNKRYTLSGDPHAKGYYRVNHYRISVKRESEGQASKYLHDTAKVGDEFQVGTPTGDFVLTHNSKGPTVLMSSGIGVTPLLAMLHDLASPSSPKNDNNTIGSHEVIWIHGARNGKLHAMRTEVEELAKTVQANEQSAITFTQRHIFYSQPDPEDSYHDFEGRITADKVYELLPQEIWDKATFYMCGPTSFMADLQTGLEGLGAPSNKIFSESF